MMQAHGVRLEPMTLGHAQALEQAAADGKLWELWFTSVPGPGGGLAYIQAALAGQRDGNRLPWIVRDVPTGVIIGSTSYHDIVPAIDRVEIGYTWYARSHQRSHVNTVCKLLLLSRAFDLLGCQVVGLRTDAANLASQRAIEAIGAKKDGVIRRSQARTDGSARDTAMYSILDDEWPDVRQRLQVRLQRHSKS